MTSLAKLFNFPKYELSTWFAYCNGYSIRDTTQSCSLVDDDDAIIRCCPHSMGVTGLTSWELHALSLSLHLLLLWASFKFRPAFKRSSFTCFLYVHFGRPLFLRPSTLSSKTFLITLPSSFLKTCAKHLTPLALVIFIYRLIQTQHIHHIFCIFPVR